MTRSIARWTTAVATVALLALPSAALAQAPPAQPPQPPASAQPPATPPTTPAEQQAPNPQGDAEAAKQHLTAARNALSEMTQLPAASQLTGDARTQVSQLITNFNELITAKAEWKKAYDRVDANLESLIGDATADESASRASGTAGAVGTTGAVTLDPAIKAKLIEVRNHLDKFEQAAGGGSPASPATASPATASPASASAMSGTAGAAAPPAAAATPESDQASAAQNPQVDRQELLRHVQAIEAILNIQPPSATAGTSGATGTSGTTSSTTEPQTETTQSGVSLSAAQVDQLRTHLSELKRLLNQQ